MKSVVFLSALFILLSASLFALKDSATLTITPNPFETVTKITCSVEANTEISLVILDGKDNLLKVIYTGKTLSDNDIFTWDGTNEEGIRLAEGKYVCELRFESKYTSIKKFLILK
ncbi:MAG: FlgD immunoglobulin-like domain containing protein [Candidatus Cloacimonetes bacterium]|nr:FlgD immunoglobulin-like domain containing protein [Candidatus Cloacimonadota bacterium]